MDPIVMLLIGLAIGLIAGTGTMYAIKSFIERSKKATVEREMAAVQAAAESEAQKILAQAEVQAKTEFIRRREEFDRETESTRTELRSEEKRLSKREDLVDQKLDTLTQKERLIDTAEKSVVEREKALVVKDRQLNDLIAQQKTQLLKVANLSIEEARTLLLSKIEKDMETETAELIEHRLDEARETAEQQAREIVVTAIQRYGAEHTADATVSTVDIPSDDMKGRVIGREGRNIRAFEKATGVDV
ncbi:MAG: DUF3552 domain-containing protein, partial [Planctomycetaceae bacterium]